MTEAVSKTAANIGERLKARVIGEFDAAEGLLQRGGNRLHTGIHEARKAIRRARASLHLARKLLGFTAAGAFDELGEIGESLSDVRDAHVAVKTLEILAARAGSRAERERLRRIGKAFAARRAARLAELLAHDPALAGRRARLRRLRDALAAQSWKAVSAHALQAALARSIRRVGRIGKLAHASVDGNLRHLWRRRLRRLRYQLRTAQNTLGRSPGARTTWSWPDDADGAMKVDVRPKALRELTDKLGYEHDLRMLYAALRTADGIESVDRSGARVLVRRAIAAASKLRGHFSG